MPGKSVLLGGYRSRLSVLGGFSGRAKKEQTPVKERVAAKGLEQVG